MSFTLLDLGSESFEFPVNLWHWKAALEIIKKLDILSESTVRQMNYNGTGVKVPLKDAHEIGTRIQQEFLPQVPPGKRIFADLTVTDAPDDMTLYRDSDEDWKNYSFSHEWLRDFAEFCLRSKGFQVY